MYSNAQTNRVIKHVKAEYGVELEFCGQNAIQSAQFFVMETIVNGLR